jgi:hypothetical protein
MSAEPRRTCPSCGDEFSGAMGFGPVRMLGKAVADGAQSVDSSFEGVVWPTMDNPAKRFEHYESW